MERVEGERGLYSRQCSQEENQPLLFFVPSHRVRVHVTAEMCVTFTSSGVASLRALSFFHTGRAIWSLLEVKAGGKVRCRHSAPPRPTRFRYTIRPALRKRHCSSVKIGKRIQTCRFVVYITSCVYQILPRPLPPKSQLLLPLLHAGRLRRTTRLLRPSFRAHVRELLATSSTLRYCG